MVENTGKYIAVALAWLIFVSASVISLAFVVKIAMMILGL